MKTGYVVIYDEPPEIEGDDDRECYYGYFDTPSKAVAAFKDLNRDGKIRHTAHLCAIIGEL
jgi:hypothetical protein